jgi:hypothetical protein
MKRYIGLRNIVTSKQDWKYLMLYEVDGHETEKALRVISIFNRIPQSYIAYKTKHGYHFVGLSPMDAQQWGYYFAILQRVIPEYFSGQTLRLSLKEEEKQELIHISMYYPYLERLASIYFKRFNLPKELIPVYGEPPHYTAVYEKYWSEKI